MSLRLNSSKHALHSTYIWEEEKFGAKKSSVQFTVPWMKKIAKKWQESLYFMPEESSQRNNAHQDNGLIFKSSSNAREQFFYLAIKDLMPDVFLLGSSCWLADFYTSNCYLLRHLIVGGIWSQHMDAQMKTVFGVGASLRTRGFQKVQKIYNNCFSVKSLKA